MILHFEVKLGYQSLLNAFILFKNLTFVFENRIIIDKKLVKDLVLGRIIEV